MHPDIALNDSAYLRSSLFVVWILPLSGYEKFWEAAASRLPPQGAVDFKPQISLLSHHADISGAFSNYKSQIEKIELKADESLNMLLGLATHRFITAMERSLLAIKANYHAWMNMGFNGPYSEGDGNFLTTDLKRGVENLYTESEKRSIARLRTN